MINVLLVDDHELVRTGIKRILDDVRGFKVIGEAKTGEEAVQFCRQHAPNIVLMDIFILYVICITFSFQSSNINILFIIIQYYYIFIYYINK